MFVDLKTINLIDAVINAAVSQIYCHESGLGLN